MIFRKNSVSDSPTESYIQKVKRPEHKMHPAKAPAPVAKGRFGAGLPKDEVNCHTKAT